MRVADARRRCAARVRAVSRATRVACWSSTQDRFSSTGQGQGSVAEVEGSVDAARLAGHLVFDPGQCFSRTPLGGWLGGPREDSRLQQRRPCVQHTRACEISPRLRAQRWGRHGRVSRVSGSRLWRSPPARMAAPCCAPGAARPQPAPRDESASCPEGRAHQRGAAVTSARARTQRRARRAGEPRASPRWRARAAGAWRPSGNAWGGA